MQHLHLLIPALRSSSIRPEEEALRGALEALEAEIRGGGARGAGGTGRMRGKLNELWALVGAVNAARERERGSGGAGKEGRWAVVDDEGLREIAQVRTRSCTFDDFNPRLADRVRLDLDGAAGGAGTSDENPAEGFEGCRGHRGDRGARREWQVAFGLGRVRVWSAGQYATVASGRSRVIISLCSGMPV